MQAIEKAPVNSKRPARPATRDGRPALLAGSAVLLFAAGFILPAIGLLMVVAHSLIPDDSVFDRIGTVLMIASIPVLLAGSHLMDLSEKKKYDE